MLGELMFHGDWTGILFGVRLLMSEQTNSQTMHGFMREMGVHDEVKRVPSDYELEEVFSRLARKHEALHLPLSENLPKAGTRKRCKLLSSGSLSSVRCSPSAALDCRRFDSCQEHLGSMRPSNDTSGRQQRAVPSGDVFDAKACRHRRRIKGVNPAARSSPPGFLATPFSWYKEEMSRSYHPRKPKKPQLARDSERKPKRTRVKSWFWYGVAASSSDIRELGRIFLPHSRMLFAKGGAKHPFLTGLFMDDGYDGCDLRIEGNPCPALNELVNAARRILGPACKNGSPDYGDKPVRQEKKGKRKVYFSRDKDVCPTS